MKLFFATDLQGSEVCFRKLLNTENFYGANVILMGGDVSGKAVVPIIKRGDGTFVCEFQSTAIDLRSRGDLRQFIEMLTNMGFYPYLTETDESEALRGDKALADAQIFQNSDHILVLPAVFFKTQSFIGVGVGL